MKRSPSRTGAAGLLALMASAACSTATPRTSSPGGVRPETRAEASGTPAAGAAHAAASATARRGYTEADVRFMQHMIAHHGQALAMAALVPTRSRREDIRLLAERVDVSQRDELAMMRRWLQSRGEEVPRVDVPTAGAPSAAAGGDAHHAHHAASASPGQTTGGQHATMPGMLTPEELAGLGRVTGAEFDRQFLVYLIRHHEGALRMVAQFFGTPGAGQESEIFGLASDIDADQRAEIARMRALQHR